MSQRHGENFANQFPPDVRNRLLRKSNQPDLRNKAGENLAERQRREAQQQSDRRALRIIDRDIDQGNQGGIASAAEHGRKPRQNHHVPAFLKEEFEEVHRMGNRSQQGVLDCASHRHALNLAANSRT